MDLLNLHICILYVASIYGLHIQLLRPDNTTHENITIPINSSRENVHEIETIDGSQFLGFFETLGNEIKENQRETFENLMFNNELFSLDQFIEPYDNDGLKGLFEADEYDGGEYNDRGAQYLAPILGDSGERYYKYEDKSGSETTDATVLSNITATAPTQLTNSTNKISSEGIKEEDHRYDDDTEFYDENEDGDYEDMEESEPEEYLPSSDEQYTIYYPHPLRFTRFFRRIPYVQNFVRREKRNRYRIFSRRRRN